MLMSEIDIKLLQYLKKYLKISISEENLSYLKEMAFLKSKKSYDPSQNVTFFTCYYKYLLIEIKNYIEEERKNGNLSFLPKKVNQEEMLFTILSDNFISKQEDIDFSEKSYYVDEVEWILKRNLAKDLKRTIDSIPLNQKAKNILYEHYGINDERLPLTKIGEKLGITREAARQLEAKVIRKIRESKDINQLTFYLDNPQEAEEYIEYCRKVYQKEKKEIFPIEIEKPSKETPYFLALPANLIKVDQEVTAMDMKILHEQMIDKRYAEFFQFLTFEEFYIGALKNGLVEGKCFPTNQIAKFFGISNYTVLEANRKFMEFCEKMKEGKIKKRKFY